MPDASTQTTRGKKIKLMKKPKDEEKKEYNGVMLPKFVNGREVVSYPNAGRIKLCKNQDCSAIKTDEHTEKCAICDGYFADNGLNDILYLGEKPNLDLPCGSCHLCGNDDRIVRMKRTGTYICEDACDEDECEEKCCVCGITAEESDDVLSCWECDKYFCIECDENEMATYGEECHTYCTECGEKVE